jgi:hypothetical protein
VGAGSEEVSLRYIFCVCECGEQWNMAAVPDIETIRCVCGRKPRTVIRWDSPDDDFEPPPLREEGTEGGKS